MCKVGHGAHSGLRDLQAFEGTERQCAWIFVPFKIVLLHLFEILHGYFAVYKVRLYRLEKY